MQYHVKIEGGGLTLDRDVSEDIGKQIVVLIMTEGQSLPGGAQPPRRALTPPPGEAGLPETEHSIREYLIAQKASRNPDKIVAIGMYMKENEGSDTFTRDDVLRKFEEAAEPVPKNLSRDMRWTLKIGWIAPKTGQKDAYYVTTTGMKAVEGNFSKEIRKKTPLSTKPRQRKGSKAKE